jgi:hypothetical protein
MLAGKKNSLGYFKDKDEAIAARKDAEQVMFTHIT